MSGSNESAQFQGMPQALMALTTPTGAVSDVWYKFLQTLWLQVSSGTSSGITLQGLYTQMQADEQAISAAQSAANQAQTTANTALSTAQGAESSAGAANSAVAAETSRAEGAEANLQNQINTINQRLANAGIP